MSDADEDAAGGQRERTCREQHGEGVAGEVSGVGVVGAVPARECHLGGFGGRGASPARRGNAGRGDGKVDIRQPLDEVVGHDGSGVRVRELFAQHCDENDERVGRQHGATPGLH
ncbi:hypothetical protein AB0I28_35545 [Phytomonospora sp. NPDC050363]|uniref:hypothetical protein n=1 Tax=Phytomonospora sp. NPDC050363 TaxID=3155642 RepID=UPI0033E98D8A